MQDPNKPGLPEIHNIDATVFEKINNSLMDLKRNYSQEGLIDQMIRMNQIMQSLVSMISKTEVRDPLGPPDIWRSHSSHLQAHDRHLESFGKHLNTHDRHLITLDGHLQTHGEYLEMLNNRLNSLNL